MFFFPLFDDNPAKNFPITTWLIIFICSLIFIYQTLNMIQIFRFQIDISRRLRFLFNQILLRILFASKLSIFHL